MLVPMAKVRILGPRADAGRLLDELHQLGLVEIAEASATDGLAAPDGAEERAARSTELASLLDQVENLSTALPDVYGPESVPGSDRTAPLPDTSALRCELDQLSAQVRDVDQRLDALRDEAHALPRYLEPLRWLLPLVPELADLDARRLGRLRLVTVALVLDTDDEELVETLRAQLLAEVGPGFTLFSTPAQNGARGCLIVHHRDHYSAVQDLLAEASVRRAALPESFDGLSLQQTVDTMQRRLADVRTAIADAEAERRALLLPHADRLANLREALVDDIEQLEAIERLGVTTRTFLAHCWVPRPQLDLLRRELRVRGGPSVLVEDLRVSPYEPEAPVLMRNSRVARPFEILVRFLDLPRAGSIDPAILMAVILPLMFGAMVGDVGYGAALLVLAIIARRKFQTRVSRSPELRGLLRVLLMGASWSIVFGFLFGEFFGDLGRRFFGDWALWRYRPSAEALEPLLIFSVVIGAAHVVLGLGLGAWQAIRFREHRDLLDKLGMLLALAGLFGLAASVGDQLPSTALAPSTAAMVLGLALIMSLHGALGLATGPLDLLGKIGNILSYLRLAAVGLASAHLAGVANELGTIGPIWMGLLIAVFFHALNLALASFSPMIQALRLQYVEFFGAFFAGGGRAFKPFGHRSHQEILSTT